MFKKIFLSFFFAGVFFCLLAAIFFFSLFEYDGDSGTFLVKTSVEDKAILRAAARKIKGWIYHEATIHNPEGDMLPDEIDDKVLKEIKDRIK